MASFYINFTNEENTLLHNQYLPVQKVSSYPTSEVELPDIKACVNQPSVSASYLNLLSNSSIFAHNLVDAASAGSNDDARYLSPTVIPINMQLNFMSPFSEDVTAVEDSHVLCKEVVHNCISEQKLRNHGLSLSLGSQEKSLVQFSSRLNQFPISSLCSDLSCSVQSEDQISQDMALKNVEYMSFDLSEGARDAVKYEVTDDFQNLICSKQMNILPSLSQTSQFSETFCDPKYLRAAQDLLDELVSVHRVMIESEKTKIKKYPFQCGSTGTGEDRHEAVSEQQELTTNPVHDLSPSERHVMHDRMIRLLAMLDEVDRRYKKYSGQMQAVVSSFDAVVGCGFAERYSLLALRTISSQFRTLRDAIKKQVEDIQKNLGNSLGRGILPRLRYVDEKLRQQKAVQQFGMMRQPWRPQRGLPETAVSVLRAWLFEHFLHPYPKETEKIVLAKQAGLTRSQVANWFINARVRLWKPMIEDIYKEEFADRETRLKPSPEHATVNEEIHAFDGREEEFQRNLASNHSKPDIFSSAEVDACRPDPIYEAEAFPGTESKRRLIHSHKNFNGNLTLDGTVGNPKPVTLALGLLRDQRDSRPHGIRNGAAYFAVSPEKLENHRMSEPDI